MAKRLDGSKSGTWHGGGPRSRPHCARWSQASLLKKGQSPIFLAHVYYGQTAGWLKMPLGTEANLGPGDVMLDEDPAPLLKIKAQPPPIFGHIVAKRLDGSKSGTWHGGGPRFKSHRARWGPSSPSPKRGAQVPNFRPMSVVAKRLDGSRWHLAWRWASV